MFPARDLVFVDQRGTGDSNGLFCASDRPTAVENPQTYFGSIFPADDAITCREALNQKADLTQYTTPIAADDLADVLDHLEFEQANLLALSYGTRLAQVFLRRHPERVRSMVLSGVMSFDIQAPLYYARDAQHSLDALLRTCAESPTCNAQYPALEERAESLFRRLEEPVDFQMNHATFSRASTVSLTKGDAGYALRGMLYRVQLQDQIPAAIERALADDWSTFAEVFVQRRFRRFATGLHLSVLCSEEVRFIEENEIENASSEAFLDDYIVREMKNACAEWPLAELPPNYHDPVVSDVPVLLLSGEFDPVTPPIWAERVAATLRNSVHLVMPGGGHGVTEMRGDPTCSVGIVAQFVETRGAPNSDCLSRVPKPTFATPDGRLPRSP